MKNILITGVNGLVGSHVARNLLQDGYAVRGLLRRTSDRRSIQDLDIEIVEGDVRDRETVARACSGIDTVFHTAAIISYWRREREQMFAVNIEGTRNVVECALEAGVGRFVHTSSVAALPLFTEEAVTTEDTPHDGEFLDVGYRIAKYRSEQIVLDALHHGLNAVILNPSIIIGPGDYRFHGGRMIRDVYLGRIFYAPPGGSSVVSVRDAARAHVAAARTGRAGERYILAGDYLSFKEMFRITAEVVGGIPPLFTVPTPIVKSVALLSEGISRMFRSRPWVSKELVAGIKVQKKYSSEKAKRELGFSPGNLKEILEETFAWYKEVGLL